MFQITDIKGEKHNINFSNFKSGLYHIDCMEALRQMPDKCIELCICDPPYGIGVDGQIENDKPCCPICLEPLDRILKYGVCGCESYYERLMEVGA